MRIISGKYKGYRLKQPHFEPTRPTTDFAKEALFNVINNYFNFNNLSILDLFAGTGAISYEFLSRGAQEVTSVEIHRKCIEFIKQTSRHLNFSGHHIIQADVFQFLQLQKKTYDIIFAGPPYALPELPQLPDIIFEKQLVEGEGWFILEHNPQYSFDLHPHFWKQREYGTTIFSIFMNQPQGYDER
ncbi:MAG: RsmD family RNA methyltransferase [Chitinophagales bacterium]|nr:RsmD family RNA methyltransferase [Chitinophagales bacterium]MDW8274713.1 RsmD family RNA methyltransferase [Chitinophagales bacterium]